MIAGPGAGAAPRPRICLLDYGMGNLRSVEKAFEHVGAEVERTGDADRAASADGIVLPGVGAFPAAIEQVRALELDRMIAERVEAGTPVLGICLGYQLLFSASNELGGAAGLGLIGGEVRPLDAPGLKVPHIGWEPVEWTRESELTEGVPSGSSFYFVHSFTPEPADAADALGYAVHGERFACAVAHPPLYGVQFHPEKSSAAGLALLANFVRVCSPVLA